MGERMRSPGPMTRDEFTEALGSARRGYVVTDMGAREPLRLALLAVAADPSDENVAAARAAYAAQTA